MLKIAVLVSGGGTNLQALLDAKARGEIPHGEFVRVIASRPDATRSPVRRTRVSAAR